MSLAKSVRLAAGILTITVAAQPMDAQQQAGVRVPRSVLEQYVGEYVYPDGVMTFRVSVSGDTLFQDLPQRRLAYLPLSPTLFMLGPKFTAEFMVDQAGGMTQLLSNGTGVEFRLRRKGSPPEPSAAAAAPAPGVRVPRSVLERYVGVYEYIAGQMSRTDLRIVVSLEGDVLVREGGGPKVILTPVSETRFKVGTTSAIVEFVIDEAGVTQVMGTGFQQALARRTSKR